MRITKHIKTADFFTLANLVFGFLSVISSFEGNFFLASVFMLMAVFFDFVDGRVARMLKSTNEFGKELDSLSDVVSFGIAPAFFGYVLLSSNIAQLSVFFSYGFAFFLYIFFVLSLLLFIAAGALRLARFNTTNAKGFEGLPITINGLLFPALYFSFIMLKFNVFVFSLFYVLMGFLMVSSIKIRKI